MLHGSINHASLTVTDLPSALAFFTPLLTFLGYEPEQENPTKVQIFTSPTTGGACNIWQASAELKDHAFAVYAPGLHHLAFNVARRSAIDELATLIPQWGGTILDPPDDYGFTNVGTYYAIYFSGPDDIKLECVHMSELEAQYRAAGIDERRIWPHASG